MIRICLLGLGEVGQIFAEDLPARGGCAISAWDPKFADSTSPPRLALNRGAIRAGRGSVDAVRDADLVISAVTAAQTVDAARAAAPGLRADAVYLDVNSAAPEAKIAAAALVKAAGAAYIEAAVMSPISPKRMRTAILLGGPHACAFLPRAQALGFDGMAFYAEEYGRASAAKMCRSVIVKGMEALLTESMLSARHYGVEIDVLASLNDLFPGPDWRKLTHYMISRSIEHGVRRAEEMREVVKTVAKAGLAPLMSSACAARQDWAHQFRPQLGSERLENLLDGILRQQQDADHKGNRAC